MCFLCSRRCTGTRIGQQKRLSLLDMFDIHTSMRRLWQKTFPPRRPGIDQSRLSSCMCRRHRRCKPARPGRCTLCCTYKTRPSTLQVLNWLYWSSPDTTDKNSQRWHQRSSSTYRRHKACSQPSLARSCSCPARTRRSRKLLAVPCSRRCNGTQKGLNYQKLNLNLTDMTGRAQILCYLYMFRLYMICRCSTLCEDCRCLHCMGYRHL